MKTLTLVLSVGALYACMALVALAVIGACVVLRALVGDEVQS